MPLEIIQVRHQQLVLFYLCALIGELGISAIRTHFLFSAIGFNFHLLSSSSKTHLAVILARSSGGMKFSKSNFLDNVLGDDPYWE